jgi:hypothetical protein
MGLEIFRDLSQKSEKPVLLARPFDTAGTTKSGSSVADPTDRK